MKSFIETQFGYYRLVWIFHARILNRKINHLHERSLRIVYRDSIIISLFATETFRVWLLNYIK